MWAAENGNVDCVKSLIAAGADVNARWETAGLDERTVLMDAARGGHSDCIKALIAVGVDLNARDTKGLTALLSLGPPKDLPGKSQSTY
jgi:hypothetical protein